MSVCRVFFVAASVGRYKDVLGEWDVMVQDQTKETRRVQDELGDAYTMPIRMYGVVEESIVDGPGRALFGVRSRMQIATARVSQPRKPAAQRRIFVYGGGVMRTHCGERVYFGCDAYRRRAVRTA